MPFMNEFSPELEPVDEYQNRADEIFLNMMLDMRTEMTQDVLRITGALGENEGIGQLSDAELKFKIETAAIVCKQDRALLEKVVDAMDPIE